MKVNSIAQNNISIKGFSKPNSNIFAEFERKDTFVQTTPIVEQEKKSINKKLLLGVGIATMLAFGAALVLKKKLNVEDVKSSICAIEL